MNNEFAEKIIKETAQSFLTKSNNGSLFLKLEVKDLESAHRLHAFLFGQQEPYICEGVAVTSIDWGLADAYKRIQKIKEIIDIGYIHG